MNAEPSQSRRARAEQAIARLAGECVEALTLADFAERDPLAIKHMPGIESPLRQWAAGQAEMAWRWVNDLKGSEA